MHGQPHIRFSNILSSKPEIPHLNQQRNGASLSEGTAREELGGRALLLGTPKDMLSKALEKGACFHRGPVLGNMGGRSFPRAFELRVSFFLLSVLHTLS